MKKRAISECIDKADPWNNNKVERTLNLDKIFIRQFLRRKNTHGHKDEYFGDSYISVVVYVKSIRKEAGEHYKTLYAYNFRDINHGIRKRQIYKWYKEHTYRNMLDCLYCRNKENVRIIQTIIE